MMRGRRIILILPVLLLILLAGCAQPPGGNVGSTPTIEEANRRVERYLAQARGVLAEDLEMEQRHKETAGVCSGGTDAESDMVLATDSFRASELEPKKLAEYFATLHKWWTAHNYRVLEYRTNEFLWVEHNPDGFRLTLKANGQGGMSLISTSPCVWPDGTPGSES